MLDGLSLKWLSQECSLLYPQPNHSSSKLLVMKYCIQLSTGLIFRSAEGIKYSRTNQFSVGLAGVATYEGAVIELDNFQVNRDDIVASWIESPAESKKDW